MTSSTGHPAEGRLGVGSPARSVARGSEQSVRSDGQETHRKERRSSQEGRPSVARLHHPVLACGSHTRRGGPAGAEEQSFPRLGVRGSCHSAGPGQGCCPREPPRAPQRAGQDWGPCASRSMSPSDQAVWWRQDCGQGRPLCHRRQGTLQGPGKGGSRPRSSSSRLSPASPRGPVLASHHLQEALLDAPAHREWMRCLWLPHLPALALPQPSDVSFRGRHPPGPGLRPCLGLRVQSCSAPLWSRRTSWPKWFQDQLFVAEHLWASAPSAVAAATIRRRGAPCRASSTLPHQGTEECPRAVHTANP
ncbi:uncharacterized protein WM277_023148 isoform 2-T2 [Molossus nigricans]